MTEQPRISAAYYEVARMFEGWKDEKAHVRGETDVRAQCKMAAFELLKEAVRKYRADQQWMYKMIFTKLFEQLPLKSADMMIKALCIDIVGEMIDPRNVETFLLKPGYPSFHSLLMSVLVSPMDPNIVSSSLTSGNVVPQSAM